MTPNDRKFAKLLLDTFGRTYAQEAGIRLRDTPAPLFQLLVLSLMLSARIPADKAVSATRALFAAGYTTPRKMAQASWQQRVDAITWSGYKRYDESTATYLGATAAAVLENYHGDLRRLYRDAGHELDALQHRLQQFKGIGPLGASIFLREVQAVWTDVYPYADEVVLETARKLGLPGDAAALGKAGGRARLPALTAALVRVKLDGKEDEVRSWATPAARPG